MTKKFYIGSQISIDKLSIDPEYKKLAVEEFNYVTNVILWPHIEPNRGNINFAEADAFMAFAEQNGQKVRGNTLVWHGVPQWVYPLINHPQELKSTLLDYITKVVSHFKGRIVEWDVINEFMDDVGGYRDSIWVRVFGKDFPAFIGDILRTAHAADPDTKLYINDYRILDIRNKSTAMFHLFKDLKVLGVPLHGIGLQAHQVVGTVPNGMIENMKRFSDIEVEVAITELDISLKLPSTQKMLESQAEDYAKFFTACLSVERCVGVTVWGFADKYSWVPAFRPGYGEACLWDMNLKPKPALDAIEKVLREH